MNQYEEFFRSILFQPKLSCVFGVVIDGERVLPKQTVERFNGNRLHLTLDYADGISEELFITRKSIDEMTAVRRIRNNSKAVLHLNELFCEFSGITFGAEAADDYFYHAENPRMYVKYAIPVDLDRFQLCRDSGFDPEAGNRWSDPGTIHKRVGRSPYQPFPAILLSNYKVSGGLVHGTLSQKVFYHCYEIDHTADGTLDFSVFSAFKAISYRNFNPGEVLVDEWYFGATGRAGEFEHIFDKYTAELRTKLPANYGSSDINRHTMVWGSWNDGARRNIQADGLLATAKYLQKNFPTVEYIQIDDGYAAEACRLDIAHGLGMPYEGEEGIDRTRFPQGMSKFYDEIREIGLRPAIWIGGFCPIQTPIYREHPDWFADYSIRVNNSQPLDVSKKEVREYIVRALDMLITEFGVDGVKHDFWSYAFEESNPLLSGHERSGYEYRRWWLQEMRKRIAEDGYLQTGCDIVMNNPFLGQYFTNYRYGIDIGPGAWENVKTTFFWGAACFATHTGDLIVPNSDSVGMFPGLNDDEALFCINYCLTTGSMVELAGHLEQYDGQPRMKLLHKAVCCPNNGQEIFCGEYDYRTAEKAPEIFFFKGPFFSLLRGNELLASRTVGLFNLDEESGDRTVSLKDLALPAGEYLAWNVWKEELYPISDRLTVCVPAHGSALFTVVDKTAAPRILDADLKITSAEQIPGGLEITFAFAGNATLHIWDGNKVRSVEVTVAAPEEIVTLKF